VLARIISRYRQAFSGLPREVWLLSFVMLVNRSGTMVLPFLALYLKDGLEFQPALVGWLLGAYGLGAIIGALLGGKLTDRFGGVSIQTASLLLAVPAFLVIPFVTESHALLTLALFCLSIATDMGRPASVTATADRCAPHLQAKGMALNRLAVNLGMTVGPVVGGFLAEINFTLLFVFDALTCLAAAVLLMVLVPRRAPSHAHAAPMASPPAARTPWRDSGFLGFLALLLLMDVVFFQVLSTMPVYLKEFYELDESDIGLLLAINTIVIVAVEMVLVDWLVRFPALKVVAWGSLLVALGFGLLPFGRSVWFCALTVLIWTIGEMLALPMAVAFVANRASAGRRGSYMGLSIMTFAAASVIAPIVGMSLYQRHPDLVWYMALSIGLVTWTGFMLMGRARQFRTAQDVRAELSA